MTSIQSNEDQPVLARTDSDGTEHWVMPFHQVRRWDVIRQQDAQLQMKVMLVQSVDTNFATRRTSIEYETVADDGTVTRGVFQTPAYSLVAVERQGTPCEITVTISGEQANEVLSLLAQEADRLWAAAKNARYWGHQQTAKAFTTKAEALNDTAIRIRNAKADALR